jgi:hypothetical protein
MSVTLLPAWKNVVQAIEAGRWTYGDLITHAELQELVDLPEPTGQCTVDEYKSWRFKYLNETSALAEHLLTEEQMALRSEPGVGYRIVMPSDQTRVAEMDLQSAIAKAFKQAGMRIKNVNHELLTSEQVRQNSDAAVRLASKRDALRRVDRLPAPEVKAIGGKRRSKRK